MKPDSKSDMNGPRKMLEAPIHLGAMAANLETDMEQVKSIWVQTRDDNFVNIIFPQ